MVQRRIITESFDTYPTNLFAPGIGVYATWDPNGDTSSFYSQIVSGRFAGSRALTATANSVFFRPVPSTLQVAFGSAIRRDIPGVGTHPLVSLWSSSRNLQMQLTVDSLGRLIINGGGNALAISDDRCMVNGVWHYIEVEFFLHSSAGLCRVFLDGVLVPGLDYTGQTRFITDIDVGQFCLQPGNLATVYYDDLYVEIDGNTRVGEGRMELITPSSTVSNTGFTQSSGATIWEVLDEPQVDTTDYASATLASSVFRLGMTNLALAPETIYGVQVESASQKTEAGTRTLRNKLFGSVTTVNGVTRAQALNSYLWNRDWFDVTPDAGIPWTQSSIATVDVGVEIVT